MRSYTSTLLFEQALDLVSPSDPVYPSLNSIFEPWVHVVEADCETLLGEKAAISLDLLGRTELSSGLAITRDRLNAAATAGQSSLYLRSMSTCTSPGGVCQACYHASRPELATPAIGVQVQIMPEFTLQNEQRVLATGETGFDLTYSADQYDKVYIYVNSTFKDEDTDYTITGNTVTLTAGVPAEPGSDGLYGTVVIRYQVITRTPFVYWLANQYSGSLMGMAALPSRLLPIRKSLHTSVLPLYEVESLVRRAIASELTPAAVKGFLPGMPDVFEQAVFASLLNAVFLAT